MVLMPRRAQNIKQFCPDAQMPTCKLPRLGSLGVHAHDLKLLLLGGGGLLIHAVKKKKKGENAPGGD